MTINFADEDCQCPVPKIIGWVKTDWKGVSGGTAREEFIEALPDGYAIWSGPYVGRARATNLDVTTVEVTRDNDGPHLIVEYKKL